MTEAEHAALRLAAEGGTATITPALMLAILDRIPGTPEVGAEEDVSDPVSYSDPPKSYTSRTPGPDSLIALMRDAGAPEEEIALAEAARAETWETETRDEPIREGTILEASAATVKR